VKAQVLTVGPTATIIAGAKQDGTGASDGSVSYPTAALIRIPTGAPTVYFGGSTVSSTSGVPFVAGEDFEVDLVNEILYAATASTSATVYVLRRGD